MDDVSVRALRTRAVNETAHIRSLAALDATWGSEVHPCAGGWLVLGGPGMYVNQAMAAGIDVELLSDDLEMVVERSRAVGVPPAFEVTPETRPDVVDRLQRRGFSHDATADIALLACSLANASTETGDAAGPVVIRPVESDASLRIWLDTSAAGWGHHDPKARRPSDAFATAANALETEHMVIAFAVGDDRPIGCATTVVRDGVAVLGGMSTIPAERRRGVQAALVRFRMAQARRLGCDLAVATAAAAGASERNLKRLGFTPTLTINKFVLS